MQQRRENISRKLEKHFPARFAIVWSLLILLVSLAVVILQIVVVSQKDNKQNSSAGFWSGTIGIVNAISLLALGNYIFEAT